MSTTNNRIENILITGSTGYVCRYLISRLFATTKYNIIVTYRLEKGNYEYNSRLFFKKVDLIYPQSLNKIFDDFKIKHVIHLAAMARVSDGENHPEEVILANLVSTIFLAKLCVKYRVESMIFTSSNLAQDAVSVVGIGKLLVEQYFQKNESSTRFISLRMPNVIDSNGSVTLIFKRLIDANKTVTITHPDMSRLFIVGEHAAELLIYLIHNGIDRGNYVSTEKPIKIVDLALDMIKESGKKLNIKYIGVKPGEKLSEKYFDKDEIISTEMQGLGLIKNYSYNKLNVETAINILNTKKGIKENKTITNFFEELN